MDGSSTRDRGPATTSEFGRGVVHVRMALRDDFSRSMHLQLVSKICGADVTIKETTAEIFCQILASYIHETAMLSKNLARIGGRTTVNVADILQSCEDFHSLVEFFERVSKGPCTVRSGNGGISLRRRAKLRPTLATVDEPYPEYTPGFLPVLPRQISRPTNIKLMKEEFRSQFTEGTDQQRSTRVLYDDLKKQEVAGMAPEIVGAPLKSLCSRVPTLQPDQSLRHSQKEQGIVSKASGIVSGTIPILDNS